MQAILEINAHLLNVGDKLLAVSAQMQTAAGFMRELLEVERAVLAKEQAMWLGKLSA